VSHIRQLIRSNIVSTLTGATSAGSNVFKTRYYPVEQGKLPAIAVFTMSEGTDYATINPPRRQIRTLDVAVELFVSATSNIDDTLDSLAVEVEEALQADVSRGGHAKNTDIVSFNADFDGSGEKPVGVGRFTVRVTYTNFENDVETAA
jgi:hypothetical protein